MQEELNRIRNKDYSHLDQRLYTNFGATSQLDNTIAQLAQLQKYLKSQIDQIGDQKQKQAAMRASQVIMSMNINLMNQSKLQHRHQCRCNHQFTAALEKVKKANKSLKSVKQSIMREIKSCMDDYTEIINQNFTYLVGLINRKNNQIKSLKLQNQCYQQQTIELKHTNQQFQKKLQQWENAQQRIKERMQKQKGQKKQHQVKSIYLNTQHQSSYAEDSGRLYNDYTRANSDRNLRQGYKGQLMSEKQLKPAYTYEGDHFQIINNQTPRLPMPLRRENSTRKSEYSIQKYNTFDSNRPAVVRFTHISNVVPAIPAISITDNKYYSKPTSPRNKNRQKQNQILKLKGTVADNTNRKSTKKLKLFSLI